jgi:hypothetical protein
MFTEFTLEFGVDIPSKQAMATFVQACRTAAQELSTQAMLLSTSGEAPVISFTIGNNAIGTKKLKIFNGEG